MRKDYIKFIPFSFFIILPGGEALLPAWLLVFPNSIPSQFLSQEEKEAKIKKILEKQNQSAEKLLYILPSYFAKLVRDPQVDPKDIPELAALVAILRKEDALPTDFLQYRHLFRKYANFRHFDTKTLMHMANFMGIEPVTGVNTINNVIKLTGKQIPVDGAIIKNFTRLIVARELNMLFKQLRNEDLTLWFEKIDDFPERDLNKVCFRRGIEI